LSAPGFATPHQFLEYLTASFDRLYEEGERAPKMLPVGLHTRISGRPARAMAVDRFIAHAKNRGNVWFARRDEIARFWAERHPAQSVHNLGRS
jgi:allantoinase